MTLTAVEAGEELCHCYAGSADGPAARQAYLLDHHGFRCGRQWTAPSSLREDTAPCSRPVAPGARAARAHPGAPPEPPLEACRGLRSPPRAAPKNEDLPLATSRCGCPRCGCDELDEEMEMAARLDAMRCPHDACGSGLGYPVCGAAAGLVRRRCIQCGEEWDSEPLDEEEEI